MPWLGIVRGLRGAGWGVAAGLAIYNVVDVERRMVRFDESAFQQSARATVGLFQLLALLIVALAFDRVLELRERGLLAKAPAAGP